jgi:hypothetical protein
MHTIILSIFCLSPPMQDIDRSAPRRLKASLEDILEQ